MPPDHVIERAPVGELLRDEAGEPRPQKLRVLDLFSGIGGFSLGLERTGGFETVAFCEIEPFCRRVLNKHWPDVPIYEDVRELTVDRLAADGIAVDVICGGFPCQDISLAGKGAGIKGERSGLWSEYARLIGELRPRYVLVENVAALLSRGLGDVLGDLAALGFDAEWHCIPAASVGAPHIRDRVWIIAYPDHAERREDAAPCRRVARPHAVPQGEEGAGGSRAIRPAMADSCVGRHWLAPGQVRTGRYGPVYGDGWPAEPDVGRVAHGVPARVDRLRALGNAVVPQIPELIGRAILAFEPRHDRRENFLDRTQSGRAGRGCHPDPRLDARMSDSRRVHVPEPRRHGCQETYRRLARK